MKNNRIILISITITAVLIFSALYFSASSGELKKTTEENINNVYVEDGKQIIEVTAKGGYFPMKSIGTSGMPTILRFNTTGTFDCSSAVRIPSFNISKNLPLSGITDIDLGVSETGVLKGAC